MLHDNPLSFPATGLRRCAPGCPPLVAPSACLLTPCPRPHRLLCGHLEDAPTVFRSCRSPSPVMCFHGSPCPREGAPSVPEARFPSSSSSGGAPSRPWPARRPPPHQRLHLRVRGGHLEPVDLLHHGAGERANPGRARPGTPTGPRGAAAPGAAVGWCRLGRPGRGGRAGGRADGRVGEGREFRWRVEARVAPWACLALPRLGLGRAAALASPPPPPPPPVNSSATAVTRQLHFRVRAPPEYALFMRGAVPGCARPSHMQGLLRRAAAGPVILRGRDLVERSFLARPAPPPPEAVRGRQKRLRPGCRLVAR